ncbi:unnamed protein product [Ectocarpus sp. CCAP 1310/34]|nr:unnamed protein product [Ectocarpus sp. CCAP 1310/34]
MGDEVRHRGKEPPFSVPGKAAEAAVNANANAKEQQHKRAVEKRSGASSNNPQAEHRSASSMPAATAGQRGKKVSALINRGVEWETWLVGLQHKLLLGVAPTEDVVGPPLGKKRVRNDSGNVACGCGGGGTAAPASARSGQQQQQQQQQQEQQQQRSSGCKRCGRKRHLYRMVAAAADISERASFHRGFLCWNYASRLLAAGFFFLLAVYLNALATMVATHRNPYAMLLDRSGEPLGAHTLPDLGHDLWALLLNRLGHHTDYIDEHALPDRMVSFAGMVGDLFILCHPQRLKIMRRVFIIFGTVLMMRAVSVSVTVLPDASPVCRERFEEDAAIAELFPGAFFEAARFVWSPTSFVTCGDMVFSGHTTCLLMVAMTFRRYCRASELQTKVLLRGFHLSEGVLSAVRRAVYAYVTLGALVIIGSKLHYTLDVLLAVLVTFCTFSFYHDWALHDLLRKNVRVMEWLESDEVREQDLLAYTMAKRP